MTTKIFALIPVLILTGCFGNDPADTPAGNLATLGGRASAGPISGGAVHVYRLLPDGSRGELLQSSITSATGDYSVQVPANSGSVLVVVTGGSYIEEATGLPVPLGAGEITAAVSDTSSSRLVSITPMTHLAAQRAQAQASLGVVVSSAILDANRDVAFASGLTTTDITSIVPARPDSSLISQGVLANSIEAKYALLLAGLSQYGKDNGNFNSLQVMEAFAIDFKNDGAIDGMDGNTGITAPSGLVLSYRPWENGLASAQANYIASPLNSGIFNADSVAPVSPIYSKDLPFTVTFAASSAYPGDFVRVTIDTHDVNYSGWIDLTGLNPDGTFYANGAALMDLAHSTFVNPYMQIQPSDHGVVTLDFLANVPLPMQLRVSGREARPRMGVSQVIQIPSRIPYFVALDLIGDSVVAGDCVNGVQVAVKDVNSNNASAVGGSYNFSLTGFGYTGMTSGIQVYKSLADCHSGTNSVTTVTLLENEMFTSVFVKPNLPGSFSLQLTPVAVPGGSLLGETPSPSGWAQSSSILSVALQPVIVSSQPNYSPGTCAGPFTLGAQNSAGVLTSVTHDIVVQVDPMLGGGGMDMPTIYSDAGCSATVTSNYISIVAGQSQSAGFYVGLVDSSTLLPSLNPAYISLLTTIVTDPDGLMTDGFSFSAGRTQFNFEFK